MELRDILKTPLTQAQKDQANALIKRRHAILVEKAGKGKTYTVLAAFSYLFSQKKSPTLLVLTPRNGYEGSVS